MSNNPQTGRRAENTRRILALRAEGLTTRQIAERVGLGRGTVRSYISDPDGSKDRARKDSYRQPCPDCGRPMAGQNGPNHPPERCRVCEAADPQSRKWTHETVVAAIRRWAAIHGRPPTANEWNGSLEGRSPVRDGFPSTGSVFRSGSNRGAPFASWAEAIEAAGYPRPNSGRRTDKEGAMADQQRGGYVILHEREDGLWEVVAETDETTQVGALNAALDGSKPDDRNWVAVPGRFWRPRVLAPRTIYDWADAEAGAREG